jgi:hypothetical protein
VQSTGVEHEGTSPPSFTVSLPERVASAGQVFGDIVIAASPDVPETLLVCVVLDPRQESEPRTIEVAPISTEVTMASEFDVVLDPGDPLGYPALVEVWNHGVLVASQIEEQLGRLSEDACVAVDARYRRLLGDESVTVADVGRGVAIESEADPRAIFQEAEVERVRHYWTPAARLYSEPAGVPETLGDLLSSWLERTGWDVPGYAAELGWPAEELALLRDDAFEPRAFPPERVGAALASAVSTPRQFEDALRHTITVDQFGSAAGAAPEQGMVFARPARRRKSRGAGRTRPSSESAAADPAAEFERYVTRALRAFRRASGK